MIVLPQSRSTSRARAKSSALPPIMIVSVAFSAPTVAPVTGASTNATPLSARRFAVSRLSFGSPLVASIHSVPRRRCGSSLSTISSTSRLVGSIVMITSAAAQSERSRASRLPNSRAWRSAFSRVRFQTITSCSLVRCRAMGKPMAPSPINPIFMGCGFYRGERGMLNAKCSMTFNIR